MIKKLLPFFVFSIFLFVGCSSSLETCGMIESKYISNGKYFFALLVQENQDGGEGYGGGKVYMDAEVNKTTYNLKKRGDEYCIED
mgnify:FL=1